MYQEGSITKEERKRNSLTESTRTTKN